MFHLKMVEIFSQSVPIMSPAKKQDSKLLMLERFQFCLKVAIKLPLHHSTQKRLNDLTQWLLYTLDGRFFWSWMSGIESKVDFWSLVILIKYRTRANKGRGLYSKKIFRLILAANYRERLLLKNYFPTTFTLSVY